ncbi:histidine kinase dimerization/phospho-acceptor domain-containing protein [Coxiella-like endosymbiont]|uniref:histidine kinase dimerization/phospho-acceptor domain-containing protein n=1 Tax=Coxiella-like endosymbiont TaxID=1592897 RepID=UPI00272B7E0B|nr:histidine kinase dimerization/phospho-acceptor domain-containing protein [Coxiella-like endosymbiont]
MNKELRETKQLSGQEANQGKSDFLAMMSHKLRTSSNAVLGMTQILKSGNLSEEQDGQLNML